MLVCYVSGHGFGHAVRVMEVVRAIWSIRPDVPVAFRTPIDRWLFEFNLDGPFVHDLCRLDLGALQADSLSVDPEATLRTYAALAARKEALIAAEVDALAPCRPSLILADIPALAFDVATRLGVPGVALTNFSWDWIYADYTRDFPAYAHLVEDLRASYAKATLLLRLPLHGDLSAFPLIQDIPFVARKASVPGDDVRRRLSLPRHERLVLLSFGGIGIALRAVPPRLRGVTFIVTEAGADSAPPPCRVVSIADMSAAGLRYQDLVGASDAVMTKPGYGIVAECLTNGTPIIYTTRGRFAEYPCLVEGIQRYLPHAFISNDDLYAGRWQAALDAAFAQERRRPAVAVDGAQVAAETLLRFLGA